MANATNERVVRFYGRKGITESVYQYDYGQVLLLDGIELPAMFEAYFSTTEQEGSIPVIGQDHRVVIPNECLARAGKVTLHIPLHAGSYDSEVEYIVTFAVIGRAKPEDGGTPDQQAAISQAVAMLNNALPGIESKIENYFDDQIAPSVAPAVSAWLDDHPEATTTVEDGTITMAKLAPALKLKVTHDYVTPEEFGAVGDGVEDDTNALLSALQSGKDVLALRTYKVTNALTVTLGTARSVYISKIVANDPGYVMDIRGGAYSNLFVGVIENLGGNGVLFGSTANDAIVESCNITFERIHTSRVCVRMMNAKGVLDSVIGGGFWLSDNDIGFEATMMTSYIGQCKIHVRRITATNSYAIMLSSSNGAITGLDFGYCSLENSAYGIYINYATHNIEPVYGTFRVNENTTAGRKALIVTGDLTKAIGKSVLTFDLIRVNSIDLSGVNAVQAYNLRDPIIIKGTMLANVSGAILTDEAHVRGRKLVFKPCTPRSQDCRTNEAGLAFEQYWENQFAASRVATSADAVVLVMPTFWDGSPFPMQLAAPETTIRYYYTDDDSASLALTAGFHIVTLAYDSAGRGMLFKVQ